MPQKRNYCDEIQKPPAKRRKQDEYRYVGIVYSESTGKWTGYGVLDGARPFAEVEELKVECAKRVRMQHADIESLDESQKKLVLKDLCSWEVKSTSKYVGVSLKSGKWRARVIHDRKQHHVGYYDSEILAAEAVNRKCEQLGIPVKNPSVSHYGHTFLKDPLVFQEFSPVLQSVPNLSPSYEEVRTIPHIRNSIGIRSPIMERDEALRNQNQMNMLDSFIPYRRRPPILEIDLTMETSNSLKKKPAIISHRLKSPIIEIDMDMEKQDSPKQKPGIVTIDMTKDLTPEAPDVSLMNLPVIEIDTGKAHYAKPSSSNSNQSRFKWLNTNEA